jgi:hypothetical protein
MLGASLANVWQVSLHKANLPLVIPKPGSSARNLLLAVKQQIPRAQGRASE